MVDRSVVARSVGLVFFAFLFFIDLYYHQQQQQQKKKKSSLPVEVFDMREAMVFFLVANSISKLL